MKAIRLALLILFGFCGVVLVPVSCIIYVYELMFDFKNFGFNDLTFLLSYIVTVVVPVCVTFYFLLRTDVCYDFDQATLLFKEHKWLNLFRKIVQIYSLVLVVYSIILVLSINDIIPISFQLLEFFVPNIWFFFIISVLLFAYSFSSKPRDLVRDKV